MPYNSDPTIYGVQVGDFTWNPDFSATKNDKSMWSGSESFTCRLEDVSTLLPANNTPCTLDGWEFLLFTGCTVNNIEGGLATVTCSYGGTEEDASDFGDINDSATYEMGITTSEEPIESHNRYKDVDPGELQIIQNLKNGSVKQVKDTPYNFIPTSDHEKAEKFVITSDLGKELCDKIQRGIESYLNAVQIWRVSFVSNTMPSAAILNAVGKITSAVGAPALAGGRNWLFIGCNMNQKDRVYNVSYEWQLSDDGGWDADLYTNT